MDEEEHANVADRATGEGVDREMEKGWTRAQGKRTDRRGFRPISLGRGAGFSCLGLGGSPSMRPAHVQARRPAAAYVGVVVPGPAGHGSKTGP